MDIAVFVILIVALVAAFLRFGSSPESQAVKVNSRARTTRYSQPFGSRSGSLYHAVSIDSDSAACEAVQQLKEKRFLSSEAPLIPLSDCTSAICNCKYLHHQDRRMLKKDRRIPRALSKKTHQHFDGQERRSSNGQRRSDWRFT